MSNLTPLAIERLRAVKAAILAEPMLFDMQDDRSPNRSCGSPGCIFGWALFLWPNEVVRQSLHNYRYQDGAVALGLPCPTRHDSWMTTRDTPASALPLPDLLARRLFYPYHWPEAFSRAYERIRDSNPIWLARMTRKNPRLLRASRIAEARLAARRIDHFIATDGNE
jgi:hypothetical protein